MVLIGITGNPTEVNTQLMFRALEQEPTLVIDCANVANPRDYYSFVPHEAFHNTHIIEVEMLYKLRDVVAQIPAMARRLGVGTILITTFNSLFSHDTAEENHAVHEHTWILLSQLATQYAVIVGVHEHQKELAQKYCHNLLPGTLIVQNQ